MENLYDDVRATLHSIWHRRWVALLVAWTVCVVGWLAVWMVPNSYESHGRIYVQLYDPLAAQIGIGDNDRQHDIDRVRDTLTSAQHLEKVIRATPLGDHITDQKAMDSAVQGLSKAIKITNDQDNLFEISATQGSMSRSDKDNARLSQIVVQKMIDIFRDENINSNIGEMKDTMSFLDQQLAARQKELEDAEQRRLTFETAHPELAQGGVSLIQRLEQDREQMRNIDGDLAAAQSAVAAVNGELTSTPATVSVPGQLGGARGQLSQAQSDLQGMRARGLTENHPDVIATRNLIAALRQQVAQEGPGAPQTGAPNPQYSSLQSLKADRSAAIVALQARRASVQADLDQANAQQTSNPDLVAQAQNISRDYDVLKQQYDKLLQNREELRLKGQVQTAHDSVKFQVIDPPTLPRAPTAPNRPMLLLVVLAAGVAAGVGVAFAVGEMQSTFGTTGKLGRSTGMPVLGAISESLTGAAKTARARKTQSFYVAAGALGGMFMVLLLMEFAQRSMVA